MSTNTLTNRAAGQTILDSFFNDVHAALNQQLVGRNASGVPTSGQELGTVAIPWGTIRSNAIVVGGQTLDPSLTTSPQNVVSSGVTRSSSNQPAFLDPDGSALTVVLDATPTAFVYDVNGTSVSIAADITKTGLTAAPGSNNTALINDADAADQADTRTWGEYTHSKTLTVDAMGTEITALVGKYAAFSLAGTTTEYFIGLVKSATEITNCFRGFFYDSSGNPVKRAAFSDNDVLTLLKLGFVFVENDGATVDVSYVNPTWSFTSPSAPVTGEYWYDMANNVWKRYDGASFVIINRTLVGYIANSTTACVGARCVDFYKRYDDNKSVDLEIQSTEIVRASNSKAFVNVLGVNQYFELSKPTWNITTDLAASADMYDATEQASRNYYLYLTDTGDTVMSDMEPYWRPELRGKYHPHNPWRAVGIAFNNASSNITMVVGFSDELSLGSVVQTAYVQDGIVATGSGTFATTGNTIPVITDGNEFMTLDFLPTEAKNLLLIEVVFNGSESTDTGDGLVVALFKNGATDAVAAIQSDEQAFLGVVQNQSFNHHERAATSQKITYSVRAGTNSGPMTFNGENGAARLGGVMASSIRIIEVKA